MATITNELKELDGMRKVGGNPQTRTITVEAQPPAAEEQIKTKLEQIGYPAASQK